MEIPKTIGLLKPGNPKLRETSVPITEFGPELNGLSNAMLNLMFAHRGIGLAAPQVGFMYRLIVLRAHNHEWRMANPVIEHHTGTQWIIEGCLSVDPKENHQRPHTRRSKVVRVRYMDPFDGSSQMLTLRGLAAGVVQHEIDHLNGVLFTDYRVKRAG